MKQKFLFISLIVLTLIGCQQKGYKITGIVDGEFSDSTQVFLSEPINRVWQNIDSTYIVNGKFELKGEVDSVRILTLFFKNEDAEKNRTEPFVFEDGKIQVKADSTTIMITGTKMNDAFNLYKKDRMELTEKIVTEYKKLTSTPDSLKIKEQTDSLENIINTMVEAITAKNFDYSIKAVNTILGNYIFMNSYYEFTIDQKDELFAKMDEKTKSIPRIAQIIAATETERKTAVGQPYVDFEMATPDGSTKKLSDLVGKTDYLLIDFWASWCGPCIGSFPELTKFYAKNKGTKFEIIGVSLDKEQQSWLDAIKNHDLTWSHVSDLKYWDSEGAKLYAVNAIPATVLIDKEGNIVGRNLKLDKIQDLINP